MKKSNSVMGRVLGGSTRRSRTAGLQKKQDFVKGEWLLLRAFFEVSL